MRKYLVLAIATMSSLSAYAECGRGNPIAVQYAIDYLSVMEHGGLGLTDAPINGVGRTPDQICDDLQSSQVRAASRAGYTDVVLNLNDEVCTVSMQLTSDNRIVHISLTGCDQK
jgi:hypothetical protein